MKRLVKQADQLTIVEGAPAAVNQELTIRGFLLILKRRRAIIGWSVLACFVLAAIVCVFLKPRYRAVGEIEIQKSATDGLGLDNLTSQVQEPPDALDASITLQTQATILQSKDLALKVIQDLNLENTDDFKPTFNPIGWAMSLLTPSGAKDPVNASLDNSPHRREHAVRVFEKHLRITPQTGTRLIDIRSTRVPTPKIAAAVVNDAAKSLVDYALNSRSKATSQGFQLVERPTGRHQERSRRGTGQGGGTAEAVRVVQLGNFRSQRQGNGLQLDPGPTAASDSIAGGRHFQPDHEGRAL